jgi:hypothetical protein
MKRIFVVTAATFACAFFIGSGQAVSAELLDSGRIIAAMEDQWQGHNYRNTMDLDKYVAALEDNHKGHYRNTHTQDSYIAALQDSHQGYYRNVHSQESFVAALGDHYTPERYAAIMDSGRFAGLLAEKHEEEAATAYMPSCGHRDIDYLAPNIASLARLNEACR